MPRVPAFVVAPAGLIGGFAIARRTNRRETWRGRLRAWGALSARDWAQSSGAAGAAGLGALYIAAMGASHPLAKALGAWPSVLAVAALMGAASFAVGHQNRS